MRNERKRVTNNDKEYRWIVGRVSMDTVGVEVGAAAVEVGDEVLVFGALDGVVLPVEEAARAAGTLSYELLTRVGARVPRLHESDDAQSNPF